MREFVKTKIEEFLNESIDLSKKSISEIIDDTIVVYKDRIEAIFHFVGEGVHDIVFEPELNEVTIEFDENVRHGVFLDEWDDAKYILDGMKGENGFDDYILKPSYNKIVLFFDHEECVIVQK